MKKTFALCFLIFLFVFQVTAQKIEKPTLTSQKPTIEQTALINAGAKLHDAKRYDEAIKNYRQVLKANPDCTQAMYELSYSYFSNGDTKDALETALTGTKYNSEELPLFYQLLANYLDDEGASVKAIKIYQDGIKILESNNKYPDGLSSLYYNLGVTYLRQKQDKDAREVLKKSIAQNFDYASPNYLLAQLFSSSGYRIPAFLAAARLISLEFGTQRTEQSIQVFNDVLLGGAKKDPNSKNITIFVDSNAPTDEGDFSGLSLIMGMVSAGGDISDNKESKTDEEKFVDKIDGMIGFLVTEKKNQNTFVGKNYFPFMLEMKSRGFVPVFSYIILQQTGNANAQKWVLNNNQKVIEFIKWSKAFRPAK